MTRGVRDTPPPASRLDDSFQPLLERAREHPVLLRFGAPVEYELALELQQLLVEQVYHEQLRPVILALEHPLVVTLGRSAPDDEAALATAPVWRTHRGGHVTVHGPGQLVCYPIFDLRRSPWSVVPYVRRLEQLLAGTCRRLGIAADIRDGLTGLWTGRGKIASIGIAVRRGVTWHGIALYIRDQQRNFGAISPCALPGVIPDAIEHHRPGIMMDTVHDAFRAELAEMFGADLTITDTSAVRREAGRLSLETAN